MPIYRQIADQIRYQVCSGVLARGEQMPSVRQLAHQLAVNQNTVLKVYGQLCQEKVLTSERGNGTFVAAGANEVTVAERRRVVGGLLGEAAARGMQLGLGRAELRRLLDEQCDIVDNERHKERGR